MLALVCVLIEHQSDTDPLMPLRLLFFATGYWDQQWRQWQALRPPRPTFRLSPVLPIVLYTGSTPWGSNRTLKNLLGEPAAFHAFAPTWEPIFWNLADQTPEQLLTSSTDWLQALAVMRAQGENAATFLNVLTEAIRHLEKLHGREHVRWYDLLSFLLTWAASRRPTGERHVILATTPNSQTDPLSRQELQAMTQTIAEGLIEEGMVRNAQLTLRILLEDRFGTLPEPLIERINQANDLERLRAATRQVPRLVKLDDLQLDPPTQG